MQHNIQMLTEVFNGGYHWEIVAGLCVDHLCWTTMDEEDQQLLTTVAMEKMVHFKMDKVPISQHVKHFIEFHLQWVRPTLLVVACCKSTTPATTRKQWWRRWNSNNNNDDGNNNNAAATNIKDKDKVINEDEGSATRKYRVQWKYNILFTAYDFEAG